MTSLSPDQIIRQEILALSAYHVPPAENMIKLDAMENPYRLPSSLSKEITRITADAHINRYPDPNATALKKTLRASLAIPDGMEIMLGNGSDEIIQIIMLAAAKPGAKLLTVEPGFAMFKIIATLTNMEYIGIPLKPDFSLDLDTMLTAIARHRPAVLFLAYPNNPSGNLFDEIALDKIIRASPGLVVIDEAYHPFAGKSFIEKLTDYPNLLVMRTLSKLGLAGLRLGLLTGRLDWLHHLEKLRLPYNVNVITQLAAEKIMYHYDILRHQAETIKQTRARLMTFLEHLKGVEPYPSDANFILFRLDNASQIFRQLQRHGILVKNLDNSHPLLKNCLRVTVGTPEENDRFCNTLQDLLTGN
ncbi:histidinol-phosphate transaminase [Nitrosomonas sp. HPC101]|uniref:histidinol-phosphate transaminase n=1 Tax=Nitrosomonas sp. HPC101 TaxID=1658667 RepID=UPI0013716FE1|nr:histidinol-phosphate transaminase [Nitrosomonas sp. HPC101]MXS84468.1 histidinol-phosphate transaminase [Nitrosomonas sp. HPC101]